MDCLCTHLHRFTLCLFFRSIFLKLASLGFYVYFFFTSTHQKVRVRKVWQAESTYHHQIFQSRCVSSRVSSQDLCFENQIGREMYKLSIFNFLITFFNTYFINYPRKWVGSKSLFFFVVILVWVDSTAPEKDCIRIHLHSWVSLPLKISCLFSVLQAGAGQVPFILAGAAGRETTLFNPF